MLESSDMADKFVPIDPRYATREEIETIHGKSYVDFVASTAGKPGTYLDPDTRTSPDSYDVARLAVGGLLNAIDCVVEGQVGNAFSIARPPGHHAESRSAAGFCIFNNVAIGALHAINKHGMERVLIVDWDLHHGNGTQHSFYENPDVMYFSTHQYPYYPGSGAMSETGRGKGIGYTVNVPLGSGQGDAEYLKIFRRLLKPVALAFKPDIVLVSAGFDIYGKDPLGGMDVTTAGFANFARVLMDIADECCGGKLVATLEGGYEVEGLALSVKAVLKEMSGETRISEKELDKIEAGAGRPVDVVIGEVINHIKGVWPVF
jgi:acetoin utilization deacetylase AcuC-like enzyme